MANEREAAADYGADLATQLAKLAKRFNLSMWAILAAAEAANKRALESERPADKGETNSPTVSADDVPRVTGDRR